MPRASWGLPTEGSPTPASAPRGPPAWREPPAGRMADADPATHPVGALPPEREAELEQKYRFSASWGFRSN